MSVRAFRRISVRPGVIAALAIGTILAGCASPNRTSRTGAVEAEATATPSATAATAAASSTRTTEPTSTPVGAATPAGPATPTAAPGATARPSGTASAAGTSAPAVAARPASSAPAPSAAAAPAVEAARPSIAPGAMPTPVGSSAPPRRPFANAASAGFAPPPAKSTSSPPNSGGIVRIVSSKLGLDHYIDVLGVVNNEMEAPDHDGSYAVGWYSAFGAPGVPGNTVFSAHETWNHYQGPFYFMNSAQPGDELSLDMASGERYTYQVMNAGRYTVDNIPMGDLLWPANRPASEEWLTLITCGGAIVYHGAFGDYVDRDVVVMRRIR